MTSPSITPGRYDIVIDPTNLWLTIHESIGHSTELDRVLGYEANYAGTSFATLDKLNTLQFGAPMMHVTGDRQVEHGLSTVGYDDEGVAAQTWDIVRDGVLVGYQLDRQMAHKQRLRPIERLRVCRSGRPCAAAADAERLAERRARSTITLQRSALGHGRRALHRRRQELVDRHAALQLPVHRAEVLSGARRQDRRAGEGRRLSVAHDRLLEFARGGRRARRPTCLAARSIAARGSPGRLRPCRMDAPRRCSGRSTSSTPRRRGTDHPPGHHRSRAAPVEGRCVHRDRPTRATRQRPVGAQHGDDQRRRRRGAVVGDFDRRPPGRLGDAHAFPTRATRGDRPRVGGRVRAAARRHPTTCRCSKAPASPPTGTHPPADSDIHVFDPLVPQLRRCTSRRAGAGIATFGYAEFQTATTLVATSTGVQTAPHRAHRQGRDHRRRRPTSRGRRGSAR